MAKAAAKVKRPTKKAAATDNTSKQQSNSTGRYDVSQHGFKPGESGNPAGRPKGSRNKLSEDFIATVYADFNANGAAAVQNVRINDPSTYLRVVAGLVPKEYNLNTKDESALDQLLEQFSGTELDTLIVALTSLSSPKESKPSKAATITRGKSNSVH